MNDDYPLLGSAGKIFITKITRCSSRWWEKVPRHHKPSGNLGSQRYGLSDKVAGDQQLGWNSKYLWKPSNRFKIRQQLLATMLSKSTMSRDDPNSSSISIMQRETTTCSTSMMMTTVVTVHPCSSIKVSIYHVNNMCRATNWGPGRPLGDDSESSAVRKCVPGSESTESHSEDTLDCQQYSRRGGREEEWWIRPRRNDMVGMEHCEVCCDGDIRIRQVHFFQGGHVRDDLGWRI